MTDQINSQANEWFVRMRRMNVTDDERRLHKEWLSVPEHRDAFEKLEKEWSELDELAPWATEELTRLGKKERNISRSEKSRWRVWFTFGALATVVAVIILTFPFAERYQTVEGEQRKVVLQDGSRVHLNALSAIDVRYRDEIREIVLIKGEALFDVVHERKRPFVVRASASKVVAVGTSFNVYYKNGGFDVTVVEGQVAVLPAEIPARELVQKSDAETDKEAENVIKKIAETGVLLNPDHQLKVNAQGEVEKVQRVNAAKVTAWDRGMLVLDGMPLREVASEMSRYVTGDIRVAEDVPDFPVTGVIKISDRDTMLEVLSQVVPVTPVKESAQVTRLYAMAQKPAGG